MGRLAQLVRAPALQAGGRQFEPVIAHHKEDKACKDVLQAFCVFGMQWI